MSKINLVIEGVRGDALERFAALAGKSPEQLILSWIEDRVNHAVVVAMRASGATWESVASELGVSITQARRIYAAGSEFQPVGREDLKIAEKYLKILEEIRDLTVETEDMFPMPSKAALDAIQEYIEALPYVDDIHFPVPDQNDLDMIREYIEVLPDTDEIHFPVPTDRDIEQLAEYNKLTPEED